MTTPFTKLLGWDIQTISRETSIPARIVRHWAKDYWCGGWIDYRLKSALVRLGPKR